MSRTKKRRGQLDLSGEFQVPPGDPPPAKEGGMRGDTPRTESPDTFLLLNPAVDPLSHRSGFWNVPLSPKGIIPSAIQAGRKQVPGKPAPQQPSGCSNLRSPAVTEEVEERQPGWGGEPRGHPLPLPSPPRSSPPAPATGVCSRPQCSGCEASVRSPTPLHWKKNTRQANTGVCSVAKKTQTYHKRC